MQQAGIIKIMTQEGMIATYPFPLTDTKSSSEVLGILRMITITTICSNFILLLNTLNATNTNLVKKVTCTWLAYENFIINNTNDSDIQLTLAPFL